MSLAKNTTEVTGTSVDWSTLYSNLQTKGSVPDASSSVVSSNSTIFRNMFLDLAVIQATLLKTGTQPVMTTLYCDVLSIPDQTIWLLQSAGLIIYARRIEVLGSAKIIIDYSTDNSSQLILFGSEISGTLPVLASKSSTSQPTVFNITSDNIAPGININTANGVPASMPLTLQQGFGFQVADDMTIYLNNSFIFGSLLYDQQQNLALSIFLWVKGWAAQGDQFEELFYRSSSLATLLSSQVNAEANGAVFVPYLTATVYTSLANAFAADAAKYEADYMTLSTQKVLTDQNIATAKTMVANAQSEVTYVQALQAQANQNYNNALASATKAKSNFDTQKMAMDIIAIHFKDIGIPNYEREQIIKAVFGIVTALVTFGGGIAAMAFGDEAAAPATAEAGVTAVENIAKAADTAADVAKTASQLGDLMKKLKKLVEVLSKVYELAKALKEVADNMDTAKAQVNVIQDMKDTTDGADLSASDGWAVYQIQADALLQDPVDKGIEYAADYKQAMDILVIYGQSLAAAQLAVIKTSQQAAAIAFQLHYVQEKQDNLTKLVNTLQVGEAPILTMMQQFYQKYIDGKSSLFAALKSYQASFFYWALAQSGIQPKIVDPVSDMNAGIQDITAIAMDTASALARFNPPPQDMENMLVIIDDPTIIQQLQTTGTATWTLPMNEQEFNGLDRVRLDTIRIWLEGTQENANNNSIFITITTAGNYLDRYSGTNYQFNSMQLTRTFKYMKANKGQNPDWSFDDGSLGFVQIDGSVDKEVSYAYFHPTPFAEWSISLLKNNDGLDYSKVSKITMYFEGSAIGATAATRDLLIKKKTSYAVSIK